MIKILPVRKDSYASPFYELVYNYMIGDADGDTDETCEVSVDNPYLERYVRLLNSLKPTNGHWGIILESDRLEKHYLEGQLTEDDYKFLSDIMFYGYDDRGEDISEKESEWYEELASGVRGDAEYSFLVFQGVELYYYDKEGKHDTTIV